DGDRDDPVAYLAAEQRLLHVGSEVDHLRVAAGGEGEAVRLDGHGSPPLNGYRSRLAIASMAPFWLTVNRMEMPPTRGSTDPRKPVGPPGPASLPISSAARKRAASAWVRPGEGENVYRPEARSSSWRMKRS